MKLGFGLRFRVLALALIVTSSFWSPMPCSARIFPNISSIPPWLVPNETTVRGAWDAFRQLGGCRFGERTKGLAKLKTYFNKFGYIPSSPLNFTDDFDDELESAIKTFQKNFNLPVTGDLDAPTLERLTLPRCGNADIVNGTTTMNSGNKPYNATKKLHTVGHYSFFPGTPVWPPSRRDLTYAFHPENGLSAEVRAVFARAFRRWSNATPLTFTETASFGAADLQIGFFVGDHGDGEPFDGVLGTLAHAFSPTSGHFHLDGSENWVVGGDIRTTTISTAVDLESVAVHEIGHLLGLGHSSVEDAIMFPTITSRTRKVDLAVDDVLGIQTLYGANPNYVNTPSSTTATNVPTQSNHQSDISDGGDHRVTLLRWWTILAVGFGLLF